MSNTFQHTLTSTAIRAREWKCRVFGTICCLVLLVSPVNAIAQSSFDGGHAFSGSNVPPSPPVWEGEAPVWKPLGQSRPQPSEPIVLPPVPQAGSGHSFSSSLGTNSNTPRFTKDVNQPQSGVGAVNGLNWWEAELGKALLRQRPLAPLRLHEAMSLAINNAPELTVLRSEWRIRELEIGVQDAAFDWTNFVSAIWNRDSNPVGSDLDGAANRLRSRTSNASVGWRKLLRDGGQFQVSQSVGTRESNSQFINPNHQGNSRFEFEYQHPLLRGGGEDYNTAAVRQAAIETDSAYDRLQIGVQDYLLEVNSAYWVLVLHRGELLVAAKSWQRAREIAVEMEDRTQVDVTPAMLDRTNAEVANRLARVVEVEHDVIRAQNSLLRLIYGADFHQYTQFELVTLTRPKQASPIQNVDVCIQAALRTRQEIQRAIRDIKLASVRYEVAENEVLPVLNMTLTGYLAGLQGNNNIGEAYLRQFSEGEPGIGIGFDFEIPYRNRAAEAAAEQAKVMIIRMQSELKTVMADVAADVYEQFVLKEKFAAVLPQQRNSLEKTSRVLELTKLRREALVDGLEVADLYLNDMLQQQARLASAELAMVQSAVRLALAEGAVQRSMGAINGTNRQPGLFTGNPSSTISPQISYPVSPGSRASFPQVPLR